MQQMENSLNTLGVTHLANDLHDDAKVVKSDDNIKFPIGLHHGYKGVHG